ncbi:phage tail protein [Sporomusa sphaeroides DSM 2875]|uniref:phage tail protein n=1 Tax=Sporomusa sphaeroides TaxID=47679 RepID=UPI00203098A4|nr:phage tail protein [Sporomusa sphaeroides]MCM0757338.1 phage tail protein [Sporomusa sphaeroides DSM 2875]
MSSPFGAYLWKLLTRPFKLKIKNSDEEKDVERYVETLGELADTIKQTIFFIRRARVPAVAPDNALEVVGENRKIARYPEERNQYFRRRIQAAVQIYAEGGTNRGMKNALARIGYPDTEIYEIIIERARHDGLKKRNSTARYSGSQTKWSEFWVILNCEPGRQFSPTDLTILIDTIYKTKAGHAMPVKLVIQYKNLRVQHNGLYRYNRNMQHNPTVISLTPYYDAAAGKIQLNIDNAGG